MSITAGGSRQVGNGDGLHAVVVLTDGEPSGVIMAFPSAADSIVWAKDAGLAEYRVVPASFGVRIDAGAGSLPLPTL